MESTVDLKKIHRRTKLEQWLQAVCGLSPHSLQPMVGDASFRHYFRLLTATGTRVVMDAPPPQENCHPYVAVANALRAKGLNTPEIMQADMEHGFLLITDFGDLTYLKALETNAEQADSLYAQALEALAVLQSVDHVSGWSIPLFTRDLMWQEWALHKEWFLDKWLGLTLHGEQQVLLDQCFALIVESAATQPQVFMHRDFHSANLMVLANGEVGLLDFQDAFRGPVTYDIVSLLRDCYITWLPEQVEKWARDYWQKLNKVGVLHHVDQHTFMRWFDWLGVERHLKALFTFARKHVRDQQSQYLQHIPRTLTYLLAVSGRYPELFALHHYLQETVQPAVSKTLKKVNECVQ